jgi:hypothetical protein
LGMPPAAAMYLLSLSELLGSHPARRRALVEGRRTQPARHRTVWYSTQNGITLVAFGGGFEGRGLSTTRFRFSLGGDAPCMRFQRTSVSCTELVSAWPMCNTPVTLGGGMTMVNLGLEEPFCGVKKPHFSHHSYQRASTSAGWYELSIALFTFFFSPTWRGERRSGCRESTSPHATRREEVCGAAHAPRLIRTRIRIDSNQERIEHAWMGSLRPPFSPSLSRQHCAGCTQHHRYGLYGGGCYVLCCGPHESGDRAFMGLMGAHGNYQTLTGTTLPPGAPTRTPVWEANSWGSPCLGLPQPRYTATPARVG